MFPKLDASGAPRPRDSSAKDSGNHALHLPFKSSSSSRRRRPRREPQAPFTVLYIASADSCRRLWLWLCDGLTVKDAAVVAFWAAFNTVWYYANLSTAFTLVSPGNRTPRVYGKGLACLMQPNLALLLFLVPR